MSKSEVPSKAVGGRSAGGDDQLLDAKRHGVALVVDDRADGRTATAAGAACAAGAGDLAARVRAGAYDFAHGPVGYALALTDEQSQASTKPVQSTVKELKFKIIFT